VTVVTDAWMTQRIPVVVFTAELDTIAEGLGSQNLFQQWTSPGKRRNRRSSIGWERGRGTCTIWRRNIEVRPCGVDFDRRSLRSDGRQGSKPAARRSARTSLRVLDCVLASATVLSSGSWRSPFFDCTRFRLYEFSVVLEVMPPQKNRSASLVAQNFGAMREGRPFVVIFLSGFSIRSERSAL